MVQEGLFAAIGTRLDVELAGAFQTGKDVLSNQDVLCSADIGLVDLSLGDELAFDFLPELRRMAPKLRLVWVTSVATEYLLSLALHANLEGFVHKDDPVAVLVTAIERVAAGGYFLSETVGRMHARFCQNANHFNKLLSSREQQLVGYLGQGLSNQEVAALLGLSPSTVQTHRRNIMGRLNLHSAVELQSYALKAGFTTERRLQLPSSP